MAVDCSTSVFINLGKDLFWVGESHLPYKSYNCWGKLGKFPSKFPLCNQETCITLGANFLTCQPKRRHQRLPGASGIGCGVGPAAFCFISCRLSSLSLAALAKAPSTKTAVTLEKCCFDQVWNKSLDFEYRLGPTRGKISLRVLCRV